MHLKDQAKLQHCDDQLTLLSPHHISFPIQRGRLFAMASRQFTVDSAKKREFINIFLLMPESSVLNAMRQATFIEKDIADLTLRRSLQRALPGGSIKGLKAYIARQRSKHPPHLPVDPTAAHPRPPMTRQYLAASTKAATDATATVPPEEVAIDAGAPTVLLSLSPATATKCKKYCKIL